jgi:hypothetical protein
MAAVLRRGSMRRVAQQAVTIERQCEHICIAWQLFFEAVRRRDGSVLPHQAKRVSTVDVIGEA